MAAYCLIQNYNFYLAVSVLENNVCATQKSQINNQQTYPVLDSV